MKIQTSISASTLELHQFEMEKDGKGMGIAKEILNVLNRHNLSIGECAVVLDLVCDTLSYQPITFRGDNGGDSK